jgi:predicted metalloendopeptidase
MSTQTRTRAVEKIQSIEVRAIHPNTWTQEPFANQIRPDRFAANLNLVRKYRAWRNYAQSDTEAVQRFGAPLSTVNAFYSPVSNTVTIFAGIVTEPFYSDSYSDLSLYATLGMIIGHELSHAMDNQGRLFDLHGSLRNWWAHNDSVVFDRLSRCIVREYGSPEGCPNMQYGDQTLGEDIADIIGITLAFRTYFQHTRRRRSFEILDDQQNFFRIFAQMWSSSYDQSMTCSRVAEDEHAIAWYRVDKTLRQVSVFHQVFGCSERSPMVNPTPCRIYGE